jgi:hypothetical protein
MSSILMRQQLSGQAGLISRTQRCKPEGWTRDSNFYPDPYDEWFTTVRLPDELADDVEAVARVRGESVNQLIIHSLATEIARVSGGTVWLSTWSISE